MKQIEQCAICLSCLRFEVLPVARFGRRPRIFLRAARSLKNRIKKEGQHLFDIAANIAGMSRLVISEEARSEDLADLALALNEIIQLPITMRGSKYPGVRVEKGKVLDKSYSGPVLEEVIRTGKAIRTVPESGAYAGVPVSVAPIVVEGRAIAAIGVVDVIGTIDIPEVFGNYANVMKQVARPVTDKK